MWEEIRQIIKYAEEQYSENENLNERRVKELSRILQYNTVVKFRQHEARRDYETNIQIRALAKINDDAMKKLGEYNVGLSASSSSLEDDDDGGGGKSSLAICELAKWKYKQNESAKKPLEEIGIAINEKMAEWKELEKNSVARLMVQWKGTCKEILEEVEEFERDFEYGRNFLKEERLKFANYLSGILRRCYVPKSDRKEEDKLLNLEPNTETGSTTLETCNTKHGEVPKTYFEWITKGWNRVGGVVKFCYPVKYAKSIDSFTRSALDTMKFPKYTMKNIGINSETIMIELLF